MYLLSCFCSRSRRVSSWLRCWRLKLCSGVLRGGGEARLQLGTSWYWPLPRLSPQKLKMLDTPENAPIWRWRGEEWVRMWVCKAVGKDECVFCCTIPDRALQVFPGLGSPSPSVFSVKGGTCLCGFSCIADGGARPVTTDSSPYKRSRTKTSTSVFTVLSCITVTVAVWSRTSSPLECEDTELRCAPHGLLDASSCFWLWAVSRCLRLTDLWDFFISPASASSGQMHRWIKRRRWSV